MWGFPFQKYNYRILHLTLSVSTSISLSSSLGVFGVTPRPNRYEIEDYTIIQIGLKKNRRGKIQEMHVRFHVILKEISDFFPHY